MENDQERNKTRYLIWKNRTGESVGFRVDGRLSDPVDPESIDSLYRAVEARAERTRVWNAAFMSARDILPFRRRGSELLRRLTLIDIDRMVG